MYAKATPTKSDGVAPIESVIDAFVFIDLKICLISDRLLIARLIRVCINLLEASSYHSPSGSPMFRRKPFYN